MTAATALDRLPRPPCAELLGWQVLDARPADGWIRIGFEGRPEFRNPAGMKEHRAAEARVCFILCRSPNSWRRLPTSTTICDARSPGRA